MSKKILSILLLAFTLCTTISSAFADFSYKVYNPKLNKSFTTTLGTVGIGNNYYLFAFFLADGTPYCFLGGKNNTVNGLVGGNCTEFNTMLKYIQEGNSNTSILDKNQFGWREYSQDTFYREIQHIIQERKKEGLYQFGG